MEPNTQSSTLHESLAAGVYKTVSHFRTMTTKVHNLQDEASDESTGRCVPENTNNIFVPKILIAIVLVGVGMTFSFSRAFSTKFSSEDIEKSRRLQQVTSGRFHERHTPLRLAIFAATALLDDHSDAVGKKQKHDLDLATQIQDNPLIRLESINYIQSQREQGSFVREKCGQEAFFRYESLRATKPHLAVALFQWCAMFSATSESSPFHCVVWLDSSCPLVLGTQHASLTSYLADYALVRSKTGKLPNIAVLGTESLPDTMHGSFVLLRNTLSSNDLAENMLRLLLDSGPTFDAIEANTMLLSQALHTLISKQEADDWYFLNQNCRMRIPSPQVTDTSAPLDSKEPNLACPASIGYCCAIQDKHKPGVTLLMSRHPMIPYQTVDKSNFVEPYNRNLPTNSAAAAYEMPYISSVSETVIPKPAHFGKTPTYYEILSAKRCLPEDDTCSRCLREKRGADCRSCKSVCHCYCKALCNPDDRPRPRHISKKLFVTPPAYRRDPTRLIPRIVHQTFFEVLTKTKYPNMSRMVQSFVRSGWEYHFYTDAQAGDFLTTHFPKEVREAYDTLRPGAFKADLFRYCVLLIHGGVYADVDIQLESALDLAIGRDIGFMVPIDEPGTPVNHQMCLWNGFIAAAPGHPFLAKAIETIVNQVRNRFTCVDMDETFCEYHEDRSKVKQPELSVLHAYDTLFTAGPCLLGSSINRVLGRPGQTSFHPGEIKGIWNNNERNKTKQGTSFVVGVPDDYVDLYNARLPGRTIILHQNKWDMGAHRFTFVEENLVIAATDLPDSNDLLAESEESTKADKDAKTPPREHYSKTHAKTGVYGVEHLYTDRTIAYEDIRIFVNASRYYKTFITAATLLQ